MQGRKCKWLISFVVCIIAPLLMAPSGGVQGCAGYYSYVECNEGDTRSCYSGPPATKGKGVCKAGTQTCNAEGQWGKCEGEVAFKAGSKESCNGLDDDCDGQTDEDLTPPPCALQGGLCKGATQTCGGTKGWTKCDTATYTKVSSAYAADETDNHCDGKDNDCDGEIDEKCVCKSGQTQPCGNDQGACTKGQQTCGNDGKWGTCEGGTQPTKESCDGKDNDCNGQVDDGTSLCPQGESCNAGKCEGKSGPSLLFKGTFVGASGHTTVGTVEVSKDGDKETVTLQDSFKTDNGPELRVYLVVDPKGDSSKSEFLDIGPLKKTSGKQSYEIPAGNSITKYKSVTIWCKPFGVNFGYATLVKP